jgi:xanthine dehydrogenase accessory factor
MDTIYEAASEAEKNHEAAALCTVVRSEGSTPRHVGSKMLVFPDGHIVGTVGGGELEHRVLDEALLAMVEGRARMLRYTLAEPARGDPGVCGGQVEVFVEPILPAPTVAVIGGGHVGKAVAHLAKWLNFRVVVSDDRAEFCNQETIPGGDAYYVCPMEELPSRLQIDGRTYLVLTTRGSSVDVAGLPALLQSRAAYIGVIGSRRRWETTVHELESHGIGREQLAKVRAPMGLELRAETPEEIAVSIMAEILMLRDGGTGTAMKTGEHEDLSDRSASGRGRAQETT